MAATPVFPLIFAFYTIGLLKLRPALSTFELNLKATPSVVPQLRKGQHFAKSPLVSCMRTDLGNSILMMCHYPYLSSASDWSLL